MNGIDFIQDLGLVMLLAAAAAWVCQRVGLPAVLGYLAAGILVSPHTHAYSFISDTARIQALAQIGLVFLIFSIGQDLQLQRLKRIGWPLLLGTLLIAILVLASCRWVAALLGLPDQQGVVLAGLFMVSSTAVLGKSLRDTGVSETSFGQTALTVTTLDDLVAVVMLTVVTSMVQLGNADGFSILGTIFRLKTLIVTMVIAALLLVPPLLRKLHRHSSAEVAGLAIAGLLLAMAWFSAKAGFSAALGAVLLGAIISTTGNREYVGRTLGGLCEVFGPVFFVAMGMLVDFRALSGFWLLVLGASLLALLVRTFAATLGLLSVGHSLSDATRAAVCLTPIGEFSLILALAAVQGGIAPPDFYTLAVGICLVTSVLSPILIRRSGLLSAWLVKKTPPSLTQGTALYGEWLNSLKHRQHSSLLWRLTAPRLAQTSIVVLFISGVLLFASPLYFWAEQWLGVDWPFPHALPLLFGSVLALLILAPAVALWRHIDSLSMLVVEAAIKASSSLSRLRPLLETFLRSAASLLLLLWFASLLPYGSLPAWGLGVLCVMLLAGGIFYWRELNRLHSRFEIELRAHLGDTSFPGETDRLSSQTPGKPAEQDLHITRP